MYHCNPPCTAMPGSAGSGICIMLPTSAAPILVDELARFCLICLCFIRRGEAGFQLVAMQGLEADQNLYVHPPATGGWWATTCYRGYPFALGIGMSKRAIRCCASISTAACCAEVRRCQMRCLLR
ncbi:hypothetical protein DSL92_06130 [Billgrantia gudaonensis]|uniref:Uncharacterized protein n=1 Tax=Billgrantia gudaonensis TaxID=376427 RepID=A0A432JIQ5_9GAMM|nr:hypothetical protein DSL92_06130 [Halomonas gudaonensis]